MGNIAREDSSFWAEACREVNTLKEVSNEESYGFCCRERNQYLRDRTSGLLLFVSPSGEVYITEEFKTENLWTLFQIFHFSLNIQRQGKDLI